MSLHDFHAFISSLFFTILLVFASLMTCVRFSAIFDIIRLENKKKGKELIGESDKYCN